MKKLKSILLKSLILPLFLGALFSLLNVTNDKKVSWEIILIICTSCFVLIALVGFFIQFTYIPKRKQKLETLLNELGFLCDPSLGYFKKNTNSNVVLIRYNFVLTLAKHGNKENLEILIQLPVDLSPDIISKAKMYFNEIVSIDELLYQKDYLELGFFLSKSKLKKLIDQQIKQFDDYLNYKIN